MTSIVARSRSAWSLDEMNDELPLVLPNGLVVPALKIQDVAEPGVGADDLQSLAAGHVPLLEIDRLARDALGVGVAAAQRVEQRELQV